MHARRLLCVTHVVPAPPRAGNEYRIQRLLRWLVGQGWEVRVVVCPATPVTEQQRRSLEAEPFATEECEHEGHVPGMVDRLNEVEPDDPAAARILQLTRGFCPDPLVARVEAIDREWQPDVVLVEYAFLTRCLKAVRPEAVKVVDAIDVFSTKSDKVEQFGVSDGYALTAEEEAALLTVADAVIAIQPDEAVLLARLAPHAVVVTAGIDVEVSALPSEPLPLAGAGPNVLVVGSSNPMNVAGLIDFLRLAWPQVRAAHPEAQLHVVGPLAGALPDGSEALGAVAVGEVDDLAASYREAAVVMNPARAGTGLKVKTVEALAFGRPVVAWEAGVDGLSPVMRGGCRVVADWAEFADAVVDGVRGSLPALPAEVVAGELSAARVYGPLGAHLDRMVAGRAVAARPRAGHASRPRMLTLFVQHGPTAYPAALGALRSLLADRLPGVRHDVLVLDNSLPLAAARRPAGRLAAVTRAVRWPHVVPASNEAWEFSAWDSGIAWMGARVHRYDTVALVTSAFQQYDADRHLQLLAPSMVDLVRTERVVLGHVDRFDEPVLFDGAAVQEWVRSSFVVTSPAELLQLGSLVAAREAGLGFSTDPAAPFRVDAPLSANYQRYLTGWLTGGGTGQGVEWHSRFELTAATFPRFRAKATAIVNEQLLTHRLRVQGCRVVDLTALAGGSSA